MKMSVASTITGSMPKRRHHKGHEIIVFAPSADVRRTPDAASHRDPI